MTRVTTTQMALITILDTDMCVMDFVQKLPSIVFEDLNEDNQFGIAIKTYSLAEDVKEAVSKTFKGQTIVVYYDDDVLYESYVCDRCGSKSKRHYKAATCYAEDAKDHYDPNDEI